MAGVVAITIAYYNCLLLSSGSAITTVSAAAVNIAVPEEAIPPSDDDDAFRNQAATTPLRQENENENENRDTPPAKGTTIDISSITQQTEIEMEVGSSDIKKTGSYWQAPLLPIQLVSSHLLVDHHYQHGVDHSHSSHSADNALEHARALEPPRATSTLNGEYEGSDFWNDHNDLLRRAWQEWEGEPQQQKVFSAHQHYSTISDNNNNTNITITTSWNDDDSMIFDSVLHERVEQMWAAPSSVHEERLEELWTQVAPGVYRGQLLSVNGIRHIRSMLDAVQHKSHIPRRRPNGMNRHGLIVNDMAGRAADDIGATATPTPTPGGVSLERLSSVVHRRIIDRYVRPLGRMLFPTHIGRGDDQEAYAFTIRYSAEEDLELREHNDASVVTLNVNLNVPEDPSFEGSSVYFTVGSPSSSSSSNNAATNHNATTTSSSTKTQTQAHQANNTTKSSSTKITTTEVSFDQPGMALIHLGQVRHAARPITKGERQNLVIWLFGEGGYVRIAPYDFNDDKKDRPQMMKTPAERWI
jgi:hypothetical protein